jgi:hypothetical protein
MTRPILVASAAALLAAIVPVLAQTNVFPLNGNAGIGTTLPGAALHISTGTPSILLQDTASGGKTYSISSRWGGYFTIFDESQGSQARLSINSSGQVGIGATIPAYKLDVWNDNFNAIRATGNSTNSIGIYIQNTVSSGRQFALLSSGGGPAPVGTFTIWDDTASAARLTINPTGDVGIGTSSPTAKTHVVSSSGGVVDLLKLQNAYGAVGDGGTVTWRDFSRDYVRQRSVVEGAAQVGFAVDTFSGGALSEKFRISTSGNVGIGTANPIRKLHVYDPSGWTEVLIESTYNNASNGRLWGFMANPTNGQLVIRAANGSLSSAMGVITLDPSGSVGIGTSELGTNKLAVNGTVRAKEVVVETTGWSDYVFADNYDLKPLSEVEQQIKQHGHLAGIPSAAEVAEKGVGVGEMQAKLLAKVEELTLHLIDLKKENEALKARVAALENK